MPRPLGWERQPTDNHSPIVSATKTWMSDEVQEGHHFGHRLTGVGAAPQVVAAQAVVPLLQHWDLFAQGGDRSSLHNEEAAR